MSAPVISLTAPLADRSRARASQRFAAGVVVGTLLALWVLRIALGLLGRVEAPA